MPAASASHAAPTSFGNAPSNSQMPAPHRLRPIAPRPPSPPGNEGARYIPQGQQYRAPSSSIMQYPAGPVPGYDQPMISAGYIPTLGYPPEAQPYTPANFGLVRLNGSSFDQETVAIIIIIIMSGCNNFFFLTTTSISMLTDSPLLPPELEREILVTAAYMDPLDIPQLMLVSWRAKLWVEPFLYRVVVLSKSGRENSEALNGRSGYPFHGAYRYFKALSIPPATLRDSVRHLCLVYVDVDVVTPILSAASAVEDLWINTLTFDLWTRISAMSLRRLHCNIEAAQQPSIDVTRPVFRNLTHLEIFGIVTEDEHFWSALADVPHLTHLSFNEDPHMLTIVPTLLAECISLRALIFLSLEPVPVLEDYRESNLADLAHDPRFVQLVCRRYVRDWQLGALIGVDYWSRADDFIAKRRSGESDSLQYMMTGDASADLP
ncbi:hypothetical protein FB45DRAFT_1031800 [Roridomyces roridus]|uniref:Uncharacterized protein n=1 Tax=Roridomyces roridus TaxID=1738132 RepID=A0AAD7BIJ4_9AGAR|nr:hypothetical protein FB45DRAFT_1031800 [Roridomyces roridus]